ncbi:hypothetical protein R1sor_020373 [Riccia sorocarpa]|uniref:Integrase catalytic domain-containing protein n=1 Tax=Riccia sorocarpa TaxID=122646 RepID=A0ABD3IFY4_9MARC
MIANCSTLDITMLRWVAYVRNFNPQLKHIAGKKNVVADMLSRARYEGEEEMVLTAEEEERREAWCHVSISEVLPFREYLYSGRLSDIGFYLSSLEKREDWSDAEFKKIRQKAYEFLLREGYLWKRPKRRDGEFLRVVDDEDTKLELLKECHEALWAGHRGVWATYMKLKERYWWKGMYIDVDKFVGSCLHCQFYSKVRHRDGLVPTFPPSIHFRWVLDLVMMPPGLWGMRYLVLAREDLSNFVEGRALRTKSVERICRFVLEDIVYRYGSIGSLHADRGDLNAEEARTFFRRYGVDLKLTTAMNPEGIGKSECGHPPIVHALVKACDGKPKQWPRLLPFALWADRSTHCTTTGYMPIELILGQKPILPIDDSVLSWVSLPWEDSVDRETLLAWRIRQLERREEDLAAAQEKLKLARLKNKSRFDKTHRLRPKQIKVGDWVLVYDSSLENQHSTVRKFSRRWFGPYVVLAVNDNAIYSLRELDGTVLRLAVAGKRVKLFKKRDDTSELFDCGSNHLRSFTLRTSPNTSSRWMRKSEKLDCHLVPVDFANALKDMKDARATIDYGCYEANRVHDRADLPYPCWQLIYAFVSLVAEDYKPVLQQTLNLRPFLLEIQPSKWKEEVVVDEGDMGINVMDKAPRWEFVGMTFLDDSMPFVHPLSKRRTFCEKMIMNFSSEGDTVLDFFNGGVFTREALLKGMDIMFFANSSFESEFITKYSKALCKFNQRIHDWFVQF